MKLTQIQHQCNATLGVRTESSNVECSAFSRGSVLIIVLWVCIGLVSIALYFANSMTYELRASDNRVSGLAADQAIEGAARYVSYVLSNYATNGAVPVSTQFSCEAVPVGDAKFWLIGRDLTARPPARTPPSRRSAWWTKARN